MTPERGQVWVRKNGGGVVIVDRVDRVGRRTVTFTTQPMLIQWERPLDMFLRNYRLEAGR